MQDSFKMECPNFDSIREFFNARSRTCEDSFGMFVGSKSQGEVCPKITSWLKTRSRLESGSTGKLKKTF